ncbi:regulatory protein RecX [Nocardioides guangzhouensis]|uniref:Regulatory protein RecX n=1 Tax=Nocardioides guangzhouensis TaxID=2497878 RepID=A0A4Q4Z6H4_9ACTN|nr:regulatory protein RecX [Nocardioides guangzhouensis]RYP83068.1 regulatory protein RecX [Nocardioides guangzhouensis]
MTSDLPADPSFETPGSSAPQTGWQGDVSAGVAAWTGGTPADAPDAAVPPEDTLGPEPDQEDVARKILLDQLTGQARSRQELADRLAKRNVPDEVATRLLDRFEEVGLVDDEAFARSWIASRRSVDSGGGKGLARRALAQELRRKGVADEVAREALDEIDPDDEEAAARRLVRKKLRSMRGLEPVVATRRLAGMLARKGYPPGLAFAVVRDELDGVGDDLDDDVTFDD